MSYKVYTTGEMIDLISKDKYIHFEAVTGIYDGEIISFNQDLNWLI